MSPIAMQSDSLLTIREMEVLLKVSRSTLYRWRAKGTGPKFIRLGDGKFARVRYFPLADLSPKFEEAN